MTAAVSISRPATHRGAINLLDDSPAPADPLSAMVDRLMTEGYIGMSAAARLYGQRTHRSTPTRHALHGVKLPDGRTVRLEAVRVAGRLMTSRAAVIRFIADMTGPAAEPPPAQPTPSQRNRRAEAASAELDQLVGPAGG